MDRLQRSSSQSNAVHWYILNRFWRTMERHREIIYTRLWLYRQYLHVGSIYWCFWSFRGTFWQWEKFRTPPDFIPFEQKCSFSDLESTSAYSSMKTNNWFPKKKRESDLPFNILHSFAFIYLFDINNSLPQLLKDQVNIMCGKCCNWPQVNSVNTHALASVEPVNTYFFSPVV